MAVGDVYEVTDVQTLFTQQVLNVYFYRQEAAFVPTASTIAQALADEFAETIIPEIANCQSDDLVHVEVRVRNLFDDADAGLAISGVTGAVGASLETLPAFNAWGLQLNTDNAAVRPGAKRLAGVPELYQVDGVPNAGMVTNLNAIADILAAPIEGGTIITDDIMFPVVVQRVRSGSPGNYEYRLPDTTSELVFGTVLEILVKLLVTSQISRKIGVGV